MKMGVVRHTAARLPTTMAATLHVFSSKLGSIVSRLSVS